MATADQLKALIRSYADGDEERFYAVALQVAAQEARIGHSRLAQELRDLVDHAREKTAPAIGQHTRPVPVVQPRGELAGLLSASYPTQRLDDMALDERIRSRLERVLIEQRERERIQQHGFQPIRKLLLVGPPGTGKTMTASVLAGQLALPLFRIQLEVLISKFLGETAAKLKLIFDSLQQTRAVYLFDEFDALGSERTSHNEVGEIRRVLNSFLQFLEHDDSDSLVVAATNHPSLLDRALFRRFDDVIEYELPSVDLGEQVIRSRLALLDTSDVDWAQVRSAIPELSHAELARACELAAKRTILAHRIQIETGDLLESLESRRRSAR